MSDPVNHPTHYTSSQARCQCGLPIECIQVAEHWNFTLGNALKYMWRCDYKGHKLEDLRKARFYLERSIQQLEKDQAAKTA